ncbi:unnamed protein product [Prunus armeniaca]
MKKLFSDGAVKREELWITSKLCLSFVVFNLSSLTCNEGYVRVCKGLGRESRIALFFRLVIFILVILAAAEDLSFTYNGFRSDNLSLDGIARVTPKGLLRLTNDTKQNQGHAFYDRSGSKNFPCREYIDLGGHGMAFIVVPTRGLPGALPSQYLGLFSETNNGNANNHVFAVELDTIQSKEFNDINDDHVGIDIKV